MGNSSKKFEKELKKVSPKNGAADSSHALNVVLIALAVFLCVAIIAATTVLIVTSVNEKNAARLRGKRRLTWTRSTSIRISAARP